RVDGAGRVVRVAEDDDARARGEGALEDVARRKVEAVAPAAGDGHEVQAGHGGEGAVIRVEGLDDEDVVAVLRAGQEGEEDGLAAAGGGEDVPFVEREAEARLVVAAQRAQELGRAWGGGVL